MKTEEPKRRGRPASGIDRKEQIRLAVAARRRNLASRTLPVEIPTGLYVGIERVAERDGVSLKEAVTKLLEAAYVADQVAQGKTAAAIEDYLARAREDMEAGLAGQKDFLKKQRARRVKAAKG
jgi:hypothetical protein